MVHATVNARGTVDKVTVVKGNAILATAAVEAVKRWRYEPFRLNGQPVEMETDITFNFTMPRP